MTDHRPYYEHKMSLPVKVVTSSRDGSALVVDSKHVVIATITGLSNKHEVAEFLADALNFGLVKFGAAA